MFIFDKIAEQDQAISKVNLDLQVSELALDSIEGLFSVRLVCQTC